MEDPGARLVKGTLENVARGSKAEAWATVLERATEAAGSLRGAAMGPGGLEQWVQAADEAPAKRRRCTERGRRSTSGLRRGSRGREQPEKQLSKDLRGDRKASEDVEEPLGPYKSVDRTATSSF